MKNKSLCRSKKNGIQAVVLLTVSLLLISPLLVACGGQSTLIVASTASTLVAQPTSTTALATLAPTSTPAPTATPVPSPTPIPPSPTPVPVPTKLLLGSDTDPWGEITRYQVSATDRLEELSLTGELETGLQEWFQYAPNLGSSTGGKGTTANVFLIKIGFKVATGLLNGTLLTADLQELVKVVYDGNSTGIAVPWKLLSSAIVNPSPALMWQVLTFALSQKYMNDVNSQLETLNKNVNEIKNFLEQQELAKLTGNLDYLNALKEQLNRQKVTSADMPTIRNQLEAIERETLQSMNLHQNLMDKSNTSFKELKLDKSFVVFRNSDKEKELEALMQGYSRNANNYLVALSVRATAAQLSGALPFSRDLALSRLQDVQTKLGAWRNQQNDFYISAESRVVKTDGLFNDAEIQKKFEDLAKNGKVKVEQSYKQVDGVVGETIQKVKAQVQTAGQPLLIVVELDSQGRIKKASKVAA